MPELKLPLINVQLELMKLYSTNLSVKDFEDLKNTLAKFYADRAVSLADEIWDKKGLTNTNMEAWLIEKS